MHQSLRDEQQIQIYKIIIIGQSGVGKSNIISRYVNDKFTNDINVTIGILQIWDTAGQERYRSVNKVFYKNAVGVLLVFSLQDKQTFKKLPQWLKEVRQEIPQETILMLMGNKCDLKVQAISVSQAMKFAKQQNMAYLQTSAALNINIKESFEMLINAIITLYEGKPVHKKVIKQSILLKNTVIQKNNKQNRKQKKKCCN